MNDIEICNLALARINLPPIDSFSDETSTARACSRIYDLVRDVVYREHAWSWATRQRSLSTSVVEFDDYEYVYVYPSDCVYIHKILDSDSGDNQYEFELRTYDGDERLICTDVNEAICQYTMRVETENVYDSLFIDALVWRLVLELAVSLKGDTDRSAFAYQMYISAMGRARKKDSTEQKKDPDEDLENPYLAARN